MNIDAVRRLLALADPARDPYTVAEVAIGLLSVNPDDAGARACYARALGELKLVAAAQEVLSGSSAGNPTGAVPWTSRARRFAANLRALESKDPAGAPLVKAAAQDLSRYELHHAGDGNFQVFDPQSPLPSAWLGGLNDHQAAQSLWQFDRARTPLPPPILFHGLGFGWLFLHVLATTEKTFLDYSCAVHVLEGDPLTLAMLLHMHDLQHAIAHPRTHWFVRENAAAALDAFGAAITATSSLSIPEHVVHCHLRPVPQLPLDEKLQMLSAQRRRNRELLIQQNKDGYSNKSPADWARRFAEALDDSSPRREPLRVLGITSRYTTVLRHSMAELQAAVDDTGAILRISMEPDDQSLENPFLHEIAAFKPDLIVQISRMRHENPAVPKNIPFLCWDQDNLPCMRTAEATGSLDALTYVAGYGAVVGFTTLGWPRANCIFVHPAGATHRYHSNPVADDLHRRHACDFSYVSNASAPPESIADRVRATWKFPDAWRTLFDQPASDIRAQSNAGHTFDYVGLRNRVRRLAKQLDITLPSEAWHHITSELQVYADRCFRHTTLQWVSDWCRLHHKSLRLYGRGWDSHRTLAAHAAGVLEPGEEARAVFQATKINLQIIEPGFIHSRALDGLAAGGFFLTRSTPTDGLGSAALLSLYELARYTVDHGISSDEELNAIDDPCVQSLLAITKDYHLAHEVTESIWRSLQVWADAPAAGLLFPQLGAITFRDESSFGELATRYLSDARERSGVAAEMRTRVEQQFSYPAHWKIFLRAVRNGLANAAAGGLASARTPAFAGVSPSWR